MATCPNCGEERKSGALFCGSCGSRFASDPVIDAPADPLVGQTLNATYLIQRKIGSGGMGDVYKAIHTKLDAPVALKIVKPAMLSHPAMVHRFHREARAASKLRHPNLVAVSDFGECPDGTLFMVMEYVAGKSLAQVIAEEAPLSERRVVHIGEQILSALAEAHANEILHRDLKPENVMIEARRGAPDSVKVLDFGIAKILAVGAGASTLTQAGLVCGTPGYMSPEQLRGGDVDVRSDLFSFGVVLYEMLTRKLPFDAQTPMEILHRHLSEPIPPPSQRAARTVSPALEELVLHALSPTPDERPASAEAMRERLLEAGRVLGDAGDDEAEQGLATEVLPRRISSRAVPIPRAATPPRTQGAASAAPSRASRVLVADPRRTPSAERARSRPGVPRRESAGGPATPQPAPSFEKRVEDRLARILGPVAPHLVKKASLGAATGHDLCLRLAEFIPSAGERKAFLAWCGAELNTSGAARARTPTPSPARAPAVDWDPAVLDRARRDLAAHVGPLARIIVRRVSGRARDERELYALLALEIAGDAEREAFRRLAPRDARDE